MRNCSGGRLVLDEKIIERLVIAAVGAIGLALTNYRAATSADVAATQATIGRMAAENYEQAEVIKCVAKAKRPKLCLPREIKP